MTKPIVEFNSIWDIPYPQRMTKLLKDTFFEKNNTPSSSPSKEEGIVRIVSWNVHSFKNVYNEKTEDKILQTLLDLDPDIICLQEFSSTSGVDDPEFSKKMKENGFKYQRIAYTMTYFDSTYKEKRDFGNAIYSKINGKFKEYQLGVFENEERILLILSTFYFDVFNVHLDVYDKSGQERINEIKEIKTHLYRYQPTILCGDFNCTLQELYPPNEWRSILGIDQIISSNSDTGELKTLSPQFSKRYPNPIAGGSCWSGKIVDFFFTTPDVNVAYSSYQKNNYSDHLLSLLDIRSSK